MKAWKGMDVWERAGNGRQMVDAHEKVMKVRGVSIEAKKSIRNRIIFPHVNQRCRYELQYSNNYVLGMEKVMNVSGSTEGMSEAVLDIFYSKGGNSKAAKI